MRSRTPRRVLIATAATGALVLGGVGALAFAGASVTPTVTCEQSNVSQGPTSTTFDQTCTVPNPPASTVTATATATVTKTITASPTPTPTVTPTPTPTITPTPTDPTTTATPPPPPGLLYKPGSYLYSAPGSVDQAATAAMQQFVSTFVDQKATPYPLLRGVGGNKWGMAAATGTASDPLWTISGPGVTGRLLNGFHAPDSLAAEITGTSDSPMVVDDEADGISIWAAGVAQTGPHSISVTAAGYFVHGTNGLDKRAPGSDSTENAVSRGRIPDTMVITKAQMDAAEAAHTDLGHVLEIFWAETGPGHRLPMVGDEGDRGGWGQEGQRIAIRSDVDLSARSCSPVALVIAETLQRHGAYIGDNSGGGAGFKMEPGAFGNTVTGDELKGCVSWADFVATN